MKAAVRVRCSEGGVRFVALERQHVPIEHKLDRILSAIFSPTVGAKAAVFPPTQALIKAIRC